MIIRIVKMTFRKECVSDFKALFERYKEEIARQPGCTHLELLQDKHLPHVFMTYSWWDNEYALNEYRNSETFGKVWPETKKLFLKKPEAFSMNQVFKVHTHSSKL